MKKQKYVCKNCRREFVIEIFEEGEAKEKRLPTSPVRCRYCGSGNLEKI
jgi:DNA-directed RNA polymerase subunit RPC12/RpoP